MDKLPDRARQRLRKGGKGTVESAATLPPLETPLPSWAKEGASEGRRLGGGGTRGSKRASLSSSTSRLPTATSLSLSSSVSAPVLEYLQVDEDGRRNAQGELVLGGAPEPPVLRMGPDNVPLRFAATQRNARKINPVRETDALKAATGVRPFGGPVHPRRLVVREDHPLHKAVSPGVVKKGRGGLWGEGEKEEELSHSIPPVPEGLGASASVTSLAASVGSVSKGTLGLVEKLLGEDGVAKEALAQALADASRIPPSHSKFLRLDQGRLPLERFDSEDFETHSPEEWVRMRARGFSPYFSAGEWDWHPVQVMEYDAEKLRYRVQFVDKKEEEEGEEGEGGGGGKEESLGAKPAVGREKWVTRLNLLFEKESREGHARRILSAMARREKTKESIRKQHFVLETAPVDCAPIPDGLLADVYAKASTFKGSFAFKDGDRRKCLTGIVSREALDSVFGEVEEVEDEEEDVGASSDEEEDAGRRKRGKGKKGKGGGRVAEDEEEEDGVSMHDEAGAEAIGVATRLLEETRRLGKEESEKTKGKKGKKKKKEDGSVGKGMEVLLEDASRNPLLGQILGEVVDEYDLSVKGAVLDDNLRRAGVDAPGLDSFQHEAEHRAVVEGIMPGPMVGRVVGEVLAVHKTATDDKAFLIPVDASNTPLTPLTPPRSPPSSPSGGDGEGKEDTGEEGKEREGGSAEGGGGGGGGILRPSWDDGDVDGSDAREEAFETVFGHLLGSVSEEMQPYAGPQRRRDEDARRELLKVLTVLGRHVSGFEDVSAHLQSRHLRFLTPPPGSAAHSFLAAATASAGAFACSPEERAALRDQAALLRLPPPTKREATRWFGKMQVRGAAAALEKGRVAAATAVPCLSPAVIRALHGLGRLYSRRLGKVTVMDASASELALPCDLKEYKQKQVAYMSESVRSAVIEWPREATHHLMDVLGKEADEFDFFTQDLNAHLRSKLRRVLLVAQRIMATQLRDLVRRSVTSWVSFLHEHSPGTAEDRAERGQEADDPLTRAEELAERTGWGQYTGAAFLDNDEIQPYSSSSSSSSPRPPALLPGNEDMGFGDGVARSFGGPALFKVRMVLRPTREERDGSGGVDEEEGGGDGKAGEKEGRGKTESVGQSSTSATNADGTAVDSGVGIVGKMSVETRPTTGEIRRLFLSGLAVMSAKMREVKEIEQRCMTIVALPGAPRPLLPLGQDAPDAVGADDLMDRAQELMEDLLGRGLDPVADMVQRYEKFCWLLEMNPESHAAEFFRGNTLPRNTAIDASIESNASISRRMSKRDLSPSPTSDSSSTSPSPAPSSPKKQDPADLSKSVSKEPTEEEIFTEIREFHDAADAVARISLPSENLGLVELDCQEVRDLLSKRARQVRDALIAMLLHFMRQEAQRVAVRFVEILKRVAEKPENEQELVELQEFIKRAEVETEELMAATDKIHDRMDRIGTDFAVRMSREDVHMFWSLREWPIRVNESAEESLHDLENRRERMTTQIEKERLVFDKEITALEDRISAFKSRGGVEPKTVIQNVDEANAIDSAVQKAIERAADFNRREKLLELPLTDYSLLETEMQAAWEPFFKLWTAFSDFNTKHGMWVSGPFLELKAEEVSDDVTEWLTFSTKFIRANEDAYPEPAAVAEELKSRTVSFRAYVPVIENLASSALKGHHWLEIGERIGHPHIYDEDLTLQQLLDIGILDHMEVVEDVAVKATKEQNLDRALDAMEKEWSEIDLEVMEYKETGTFVIKGTDDIFALLDDHIAKTQSMLGSPYITNIRDKCESWLRKVTHIQLLLEEWLRVQRTWMYLQPIFSSDDIMRQMPAEGRRFGKVDRIYRQALADTAENPRVLNLAKKEALLPNFRKANAELDVTTKNLAEYLEVKRLAFPRFYFLSNDGLLEILSQTKDPRAAQKHLDKCFEGLNKITFRGEAPKERGGTGNPEDLAIIEIKSHDGETVPLIKFVDPNAPGNVGNVEVWLNQLLHAMRISVKDFVQRAIDAYPKTERTKWVLEHPAQAVLNISQLYWTQEVETAFRRGGNKGLKDYVKKLDSQLDDIVKLVRGDLKKQQRVTLGALTVIDVHARDVCDAMAKAGVGSKTEFDWMAQLRYYWEDQNDEWNRYGDDPMNLIGRIINSSIMYGYEYLGNSSRLVITPLTDRCYRTLIGAVALQYGGAPAGPAGTGKTETTKDLSKALAIFCVVYNCSDQLRVEDMAKFFKGLAGCGAWACFDEFNRISLEVLSVVAQQIQLIVNAKRQKLKTFEFWGTKLKLNPDVNVFITMNPGYAGRAELPDNLKALFRPCAMMVPDYAMIAEIKLFSFGFSDARNMARKLVQVLRLSSEQLSSQKHYDYGMRAVFSIIVRAGNLRQQLGDTWSEDLIVLSAINDVNLPKFTTNDLPLFRGITQDLFPGVTLPETDYRMLLHAVHSACQDRNLQIKDEFINSVVQLRETVAVRHGLMVVGGTMSGKTCVTHTLADAFGRIAGKDDYAKVHLHTINPKSIKQSQLYGFTDVNTQEWTDGILAVTFRNASTDDSKDWHWIVFDGPVDAVWIEDMNTVLDDNKKLCLTSGEIIKMSGMMRMMFEAEDLKEASPATVSRVGMVFMEPQRVGWRPLVQSWVDCNIAPALRLEATGDDAGVGRGAAEEGKDEDEGEEGGGEGGGVEEEDAPPARVLPPLGAAQKRVLELFEWIIPPLMHFMHKKAEVLCPVTTIELVESTVNMMDSLLQDAYADNELGSLASYANKDVVKVVEGVFVLSVVWCIGSLCDHKSRSGFDEYLRKLLSGDIVGHPVFEDFLIKNPAYDSHFVEGGIALSASEGDARGHEKGARFKMTPVSEGDLMKVSITLPAERQLFDWVCRWEEKGAWKDWMNGVETFRIPDDASFNRIMVPTVDTIRNEWLIDLLALHGHHILCVGNTGTGKSVQIVDKIVNHMGGEEWAPLLMTFSAQTSANQTQDIIDGKLKRRRKGIYGPPLGKKYIIFVDDLNMPAKETYGAQPPIELLRQWMDHKGWYDRNDKEQAFMTITDVQFIAAMGPPGGGRTRITQRYVRHFNIIGYTPFAQEQLQRVFETLLSWSLNSFNTKVKGVVKDLVKSTVSLYSTIEKDLRPTPAKSHYTFNLRDISKVFQGIHQASPEEVKDDTEIIRLWAHECTRVFHDRLVDETDRSWFHDTIAAEVKKQFKKEWEMVRGDHPNLIYGNFLDLKNRRYQELSDRDALRNAVNTFLEDYNIQARNKMSLVLFENAIEHVARIARVIQLPLGNALLVGVGGSGRKSLTTLAVFIAEMTLFEVEVRKGFDVAMWREELRKVLIQAGAQGKPTVFMLSDTQIVNEIFVEDINNILNNGEVPNLWEGEAATVIAEACQDMSAKLKLPPMTADQLYSYFVDRSRDNLHLVLCFSPIGEAFRTRMRMFPALINCTSLDWFTAWPEEALRSVARYFLDDPALDLGEEVLGGVVDVCVEMQRGTDELAEKFYAQLRRRYYVTPTSYLELINTFKDLINSKREELLGAKGRYEEGLKKLRDTRERVGKMQETLEELKPKLLKAKEETAVMIEEVKEKEADASVKAEHTAAEEAAAKAQAANAEEIRAECEADLSRALPIMERAQAALRTITSGDIAIVKKLGNNAPAGVRTTLEAVCIMLQVPPRRIPNPDGTGKILSYWEAAKKELLTDTGFIKRLLSYDQNNIPPEVIEKIKPYYDDKDFVPEKVKNAAGACEGLCKWVRGMVDYDEVAKVVKPKQEALAEAQASADTAMATLAAKQAELKEVMDKLEELRSKLKSAMEERERLQNEYDSCESQLARAKDLIEGLGGEQDRWTEAAEKLQVQYDNVVGDILLSAGLTAYLGAFTGPFREEAIERWSARLREVGITCAEKFSLADTLGDPVQIRAWGIQRLPVDSFSVDNAIMMTRSKRWPLMIDPQGQANRWIRNMEKENNLAIIKQNSTKFARTIESSLAFGHPVLLENVPEVIDPTLENVLTRRIIRVGAGMAIRVGDNTVEYDPAFKLYITTKLPNPHFSPETCVKVNLLNFMATTEGLEDQMLGITMAKLEQELEERREKLVLEDAENKRQLFELEDRILKLLAAAEGNILEDDALIKTLKESKVTSNTIMKAVEIAERNQKRIDETRTQYRPVASRASTMFFCIADLASVDPMYQYSLEWFVQLFDLAISKIDRSGGIEEVVEALNNMYTKVLYENVCRSLFEKHKLLFSFLLCVKLLLSREEDPLSSVELRFLMQGASSVDTDTPNPTDGAERKWLLHKSWADFLALSRIERFADVKESLLSNTAGWEEAFDASDPTTHFAGLLGREVDSWDRLLIVRCLRADKVVPAIRDFVSENLGEYFIDPPPFDLRACYADSTSTTPLIFILSPGADPMSELQALAEREGKLKHMKQVSLGQGQGPTAEAILREGVDTGLFCVLQNCHLASTWMPTLERLVEELHPETTADSFRLWLTSMPSADFPVPVLQSGIKITLEPPRGMRSSLIGSYNRIDREWFEGCSKPREFKKLLFGLCFFHAVVRERRRFGPLGWCIPYDFSEPDLQISQQQLRIFLDESAPGVVPYDALTYLVGEANYGGRVTDGKDRRLIMCILSDFYTPEILKDGYKFSKSGIFYAPKEGPLEKYIEYVKSLPIAEGPEVYGLHDNADITRAINEAEDLLSTALSLQPRSSGSGTGKTWEEEVDELAADIESRLPELFDLERIAVAFPILFEESLNCFLQQETARYNNLLNVVGATVRDLQLAVKGLVVLSSELEAIADSLVQGRVPDAWAAAAFASQKPLAAWTVNLVNRVKFYQDWVAANKTPSSFWCGAVFFPQSLLTGIRQNAARKHKTAIDELMFDFYVLKPDIEITEAPEDGAFVTGLFLEGAGWDAERDVLCDSEPKVLFVSLPPIHFLPRHVDALETHDIDKFYSSPLFTVARRAGELSTTGLSTSFVGDLQLPFDPEHFTSKTFVKLGCACLTQLSS